MLEFNPHQSFGDHFKDAIPFIMEGQVVDTADPDQMGRCRVWVPALDGEAYDINQIPWADYASPFMGFTVEYPGGAAQTENKSHSAFGMWAIPKIGGTVLVFFLNGNPSSRFYFASTARLHRNRSLPAGRNTDFFGRIGPWGDAGDGQGNLNPIQPAYDNLRTQFQNQVEASEAQTRGAYERQVAQPKRDKDGTEGYSPNAADPSYLDPQTYCIVTPGRNAIIMQDDPKFARTRIKTAEGNQIILDDANERIYVSTAKGNSWFEMDQDGHVQVFGAQSLSFRAGKDINFFADGNINMEANLGVNVKANGADIRMSASGSIHSKAGGSILQSACDIFDMSSETSMKLTALESIDVHAKTTLKASADSSMDLKTGGKLMAQGASMGLNGGSSLKASAGRIDLNGPGAGSATAATDASCAEAAESPAIVPGFEPWTRPESTTGRNPHWKP
jgi:phage gp45-like